MELLKAQTKFSQLKHKALGSTKCKQCSFELFQLEIVLKLKTKLLTELGSPGSLI
jgi:hypothetical protein